jgi:hypothetical protein
MNDRGRRRAGPRSLHQRRLAVCLMLVAGCSKGGSTSLQNAVPPAASAAPDPVADSEGDTTLLGTDADHNGVRDDVDAYMATLETDPQKRTALVSFAREATAMMVLGATDGTTKDAALAQAQRVGRTIDCLHDLYVDDLLIKQTILQVIRSALYDNALRLTAYNHASSLVSGSLFRASHGCDPAITGVSR